METDAGSPSARTPRSDADAAPQSDVPRLTCRRMVEADIVDAVALLARGFPERSSAYWAQALDRLRTRPVPDDRPRYGYVLVDRARLVGIVLVVFAETDQGTTRGNVSSWYVHPDYRGFSNILLSPVLKAKAVTLFNISPAPATVGTIEAQGFKRYVGGAFLSVPVLARGTSDASVRRIEPGASGPRILSEHAGWGCLAFEVVHSGRTHPFVFVRQRILGGRLPCVQLAYCRDLADFIRFAAPLGRRLLRLGVLLVLADTDQPLPGLRGILRPGRNPRFCRGPDVPRAGDLSYTELAIFGA